MGTRTILPYLVGLAPHDERFGYSTLNRVLLTASEYGPEPDQPEATVTGELELAALGSAPDAGQTLTVEACKEGAAVLGDAGGRFAWGEDGDADLGWWNYNKISRWERGRSEASADYFNIAALKTPGHKALVFYADDTGANTTISVSVRDPETGTWAAAVDIYTYSGTATAPTVIPVRLPSGRVLALYTREDYREGSTAYLTLGYSYSDDDGATWTEGGRHIAGLRETLSGVLGAYGSSAVYHNGYLTILLNLEETGPQPNTIHLVSADRGGSVTEVERFDGGNTREQFRVVTDRVGTPVVVYTNSSDGKIYAGRKPGPYRKFATDPSYDTVLRLDAGVNSDGRCGLAATISDEGHLWVVWQKATTERYRIGMARYSVESLAASNDRWTASGAGANYDTNWPMDLGNDDSKYLKHLCLVPHKGSLLLCATAVATGSYGAGLHVFHLGGYSSVDWHRHTFGRHSGGTPYSIGRYYAPIALPHQLGFTHAASGGSNTLTGDGLGVTTSATNDYWDDGSSATLAQPAYLHWGAKLNSGGSLTSPEWGGRIKVADGVNEYEAWLCVTTTGAAVYDRYGTVSIASVTGLTASQDREYLLGVEPDPTSTPWAVLYTRPLGTARWTLVGKGHLTDKGSSPASTNEVSYGAIATGSVDGVIYFAGIIDDEEDTSILLNDATRPLEGRAFATRPLYVEGGTQIRAAGGTAYRGDRWAIGTRFSHGLHLTDPMRNASPSRYWEAQDEAEQLIPWTPSGAGVETMMLASTWVVGLFGTNAAQASFEGYDGSWHVLGSFDSRVIAGGGSLSYSIDGDWVRPSLTTTKGLQIPELHELVGATARLQYTGGDGLGTLPVRIVEASGGLWADPRATRPLEFRVEVLADERDLSDVGTPTTLDIIPSFLVGVVHNLGTAYATYGVRLPTQTTDTGRIRCGPIVVAPLIVFGRKPARGAQTTLEANLALTEDRAGARLGEQLGPERRVVTLPYSDLIPLNELYKDNPDPRYVPAEDSASSKGLAFRHDAALFQGLYRRMRGGAVPGIWLPRVDLVNGATATYVYALREMAMLCRMLGSVSRRRALGWTREAPVETLDGLRLEEEV